MVPQVQTLQSFLRIPFGRQDVGDKLQEYERRYREYYQTNRIRVVAMTEIEGAYYIHIEVPSESAKEQKYKYDVVIRFFTNDPQIAKEGSLRNYYVQFFSNSPSFIYRYAVLYKQHGALIEFLYDKMSRGYEDKLPEKTNQSMELSFDKSIFFAAKYLSERKFRYLNKFGMLIQRKKTPEKFFAGIKDFETVRLERSLIAEEKKLKKEMDRYKAKKGKKAPPSSAKRFALQDTLTDHQKPGITYTQKTTAKRSTSKGTVSVVRSKKKTARKTTYRGVQKNLKR